MQDARGLSHPEPPQPTKQWHSPRTHTPRPEHVGSRQSTVKNNKQRFEPEKAAQAKINTHHSVEQEHRDRGESVVEKKKGARVHICLWQIRIQFLE